MERILIILCKFKTLIDSYLWLNQLIIFGLFLWCLYKRIAVFNTVFNQVILLQPEDIQQQHIKQLQQNIQNAIAEKVVDVQASTSDSNMQLVKRGKK